VTDWKWYIKSCLHFNSKEKQNNGTPDQSIAKKEKKNWTSKQSPTSVLETVPLAKSFHSDQLYC